jgi:hypothetical protein
MHYMPLPVNVSYVAKPLSQRLKKRVELLEQWMKSHPFISTALGAVLGAALYGIIQPIVVPLFLSFVGNPFAGPDVTVDGSFYPGFEGQAIYPFVYVYNAGDATAKNCYVTVTDMQTQKDFVGPTLFSVPPNQEHAERLEIPVPELSKGQTSGRREYRIRAVCSNDVSPDSYSHMDVY